jgi:hypothetical protein
MFLPIIGDLLVEVRIVIFGNVLWFSHPDWNGLVDSLKLMRHFLDLLSLFLLFFFLSDLKIIFFLFISIFFLFLRLSLFISNLFLSGLFSVDLNWELDEFRVLLNQFLDLFLLQVLKTFWLEVKDQFASSSQRLSLTVILSNRESTSSSGLPNVLLVMD